MYEFISNEDTLNTLTKYATINSKYAHPPRSHIVLHFNDLMNIYPQIMRPYQMDLYSFSITE